MSVNFLDEVSELLLSSSDTPESMTDAIDEKSEELSQDKTCEATPRCDIPDGINTSLWWDAQDAVRSALRTLNEHTEPYALRAAVWAALVQIERAKKLIEETLSSCRLEPGRFFTGLPVELWWLIFDVALHTDCYYEPSDPGPIRFAPAGKRQTQAVRGKLRLVCHQWKDVVDSLPEFSTTKITQKNTSHSWMLSETLLPMVGLNRHATTLDIDLTDIKCFDTFEAIVSSLRPRDRWDKRKLYSNTDCSFDTAVIHYDRSKGNTEGFSSTQWSCIPRFPQGIRTLWLSGNCFARLSMGIQHFLGRHDLDTLVIEHLGSFFPSHRTFYDKEGVFGTFSWKMPHAICRRTTRVPKASLFNLSKFTSLRVLGLGSLDLSCARCIQYLPKGLEELHLYRGDPTSMLLDVQLLLKRCARLCRIVFHDLGLQWIGAEPERQVGANANWRWKSGQVGTEMKERLDKLYEDIAKEEEEPQMRADCYATFLKGSPFVSGVVSAFNSEPVDGASKGKRDTSASIYVHPRGGELRDCCWTFDIALKPRPAKTKRKAPTKRGQRVKRRRKGGK